MSAQNHRSPRRPARKTTPARPLGDFVRLEDRTVPATSLVDAAQGLLSAGAGDATVLGVTPDGRYAIFSSEGTDLIPNQIDIPGTKDLFWIDFLTGQKKLVTAAPTAITSAGATQPDTYSYVFARSTFGYAYQKTEAFNQAVISDDGKYVGFTSKVDAGELDATFATQAQLPGTARTAPSDRGNTSYDIFRWGQESGSIVLGSRTYDNGKNGAPQAFGLSAETSNPSISEDGSKISFVSNRNAASVYPVPTGTNPSFMRDNGDISDDLFLVDFIRIASGTAQNTTVVSQVANPYIGSGYDKFANFFWLEPNATFGFVGQYNPINADLFNTYLTNSNANGSTIVGVRSDPSLIVTGFPSVGVKTDLLGRYMSGAGDTQTFLTDVNPGWLNGQTFTFANVPKTGQNQYDVYVSNVPNVDQGGGVGLRIATITDQTNLPNPSALVTIATTGGSADNAIIARGDGTRVLFTAGVGGTTPGKTLIAGYSGPVGTTSANQQLYTREMPVGTAFGFTPVLVSAAGGSTSTAATGILPVDLTDTSTNKRIDPLSYQITPDGRFVVFTTDARNVVVPGAGIPTDTNLFNDVYRRDTNANVTVNGVAQTGYVKLVSVEPLNRSAGNGPSTHPSISSNGRFVAFQTLATNVVSTALDTNKASDIVVRDFESGVDAKGNSVARSSLASINSDGTATGNGASTNPYQTTSRVVFTSLANNLVPNITVNAGTQHGYVATVPLTVGGGGGSADTIAVGGGSFANATLTTFTGNGKFAFGSKFTPFPGFTGEVRVASADVDGDGIVDLIAGAGPGGGPRVVVISGSTGSIIRNFFAFESSFRGGVTVAAADFNGAEDDGTGTATLVSYADVIIAADEGGGARVQVYDGKTGVKRADFFTFEATFRGGVRIAAADVNADGTPDLIAGAGMGGGPRVSVFTGTNIASAITNATNLNTAPARIVDVFAFEATLRNGVYVGGGDIDGDGFAEVVVGGGPGGGPRVTSFDGRSLVNSNNTVPTLNFFAFPSDSRDGVHVAVRNVDGDGVLDIVAGQGKGQQSRVKAFSGGQVDSSGTPTVLDDQILFGDFGSYNGAWVG